MWTAKWILDAYEEGKESVRWDLYMAYPDLRGYFDEIEARPSGAGDQKASPVAEKPAEARWNLYARLVKS